VGRAATRLLSLPPAVPRRCERHCPIFCVGLHGMPHPRARTPPRAFRSSRRTGVLIIDDRAISPIPTGMFSNSVSFHQPYFAPCLPMTAPRPPSGPLCCTKSSTTHSGGRTKQGDRVKLYSRHGNDMTKRFPLIVEADDAAEGVVLRDRRRSCIVRRRRHSVFRPACVTSSMKSCFLYAFD